MAKKPAAQRPQKRRKGERIEPVFTAEFDRPKKGELNLSLSADDRTGGFQTDAGRKTQASPGAESPGNKPSTKAKSTDRRSKTKAKKPRKKARSSGGFFRLIRRTTYWSTVLGLWAMIAVVGVIGFYAAKLPNAAWKVPERPPNVKIVAVDGSLIDNRGATGGEAVPLHEMPVYLPEAIIAIEDHRFYQHFGFDVIGFTRAMVTNIAQQRLVQGGSSLSQQLAKNLFLSPERSIERKVQELVLALWLEATYSKDQIIEMYLNRVYFGAGAYGVDAAARRYFQKSARDVNLGEAAILAGLVKAPSRLAPNKNLKGAKDRAKLVLSAMEREGFISSRERELALTLPSNKVPVKKTGAHNYIADWVADVLPGYVGDFSEDIIVETTVDRHLQVFAQNAIAKGLNESGEKLGVSQGALVSIDGIGAVRALVGGRDYGESQFNRAVKAKRQPGSSFKPFVYLTALESGFTPETIRVDAPTTINGWTPQNYTKKYEGEVKLRDALAKSLNTVAAQLAHEVGPQYVVEAARRFGIDSDMKPNPSIALGTSEVTPFELARAYVPFANGGYRVEPFIVKRVATKEGKILYERNDAQSYGRVIEPRHLGMMNAMLEQNISRGTGKKAAMKDWPVGGKTGTSQEFRDAWFAGFTANLTTVVWVGNDDNTPTKKATGGNLPADIWKSFMDEAHRGVPIAQLPGRYDETQIAQNIPRDINDVIEQSSGSTQPDRSRGGDDGGIKGFLKKLFGRD
ncbi:MAG: transglycosylase domain-containing protein [Pseudomonadota bacterium]